MPKQSAEVTRALRLVAGGMTAYAAAKKTGIALSTIYRAIKRQVQPMETWTCKRCDKLMKDILEVTLPKTGGYMCFSCFIKTKEGKATLKRVQDVINSNSPTTPDK